MFTNVKKFGSYVLTKDNCFSHEITAVADPTDFTSSCSIPPVWTDLTLISVTPYNHDTSIFKFRLPEGCQKLNLPVGGFMLALASANGELKDDTVRPYTSISDDDVLSSSAETGHFELLCKRYDQWGKEETAQTHFLFTKTNHSYRPAGTVSNHIHKLKVGETMKFKHNANCVGRIHYPFTSRVSNITMIAVGVGLAPMIHTLRAIFKDYDLNKNKNVDDCLESVTDGLPDSKNNDNSTSKDLQIVLLYGVRTVADILMRELLEDWQDRYAHMFRVVYCVGSRWANVHYGAKTKTEYVPPPPPVGFSELSHAEMGWVNEEKLLKYGHAPSQDTRVFVCGLPGVYEKLCGGRDSPELAPRSVLHKLGYTSEMVVKL